jgi:hypothetical protein
MNLLSYLSLLFFQAECELLLIMLLPVAYLPHASVNSAL